MTNLGVPDFMKDETLIKQAILQIESRGFVILQDLFVSKELNGDTLDRLTTKICESGKYFQDINAHTQKWAIKKNPNYRKIKFRERHPFLYDAALAIIAASLSLLVGWLLLRLDNQKQFQTDKRQDQSIQALNDSLAKIKKQK
jgi:hypothetical protein